MYKLIRVLISCGLLCLPVYSQKMKKYSEAVRVENPPRIDGVLDEKIWERLPILNDFFQWNPHNGQPGSQATEVRICFDDRAFYVGALCYDDSPDQIMKEIRFRDDRTGMNADVFGVHISPFNDALNSYFFDVSAANVQRDGKFNADNYDVSWDAVWDSKVSFTEEGWVVEIEIPYSALRFSSRSSQEWGLNFWRWIAREREWDCWSFVDVSIEGWWKQNGVLGGLNNLDPPLNLSISPYISGYAQNSTANNWGYSYNGGMDLKYGITNSFTLDVTLIPDFGQIQSDDVLLNLTPYEIKYNEKRQFFTEGMELFLRGGIFYSRRIGYKPADYDSVYSALSGDELVLENPVTTRLINATKLSGRTNAGLGIGFLNAMTSGCQATIFNPTSGTERQFLTQSFTNYNVTVLDQTLFSNSFISLINTNVYRNSYMANVTATEFQFADRANVYRLSGTGAVSYIREAHGGTTGYGAMLEAGKYGGQFRYGFFLSVLSDQYDQNDLGFLKRNNEFIQRIHFEHNVFMPFSIFRSLRNRISVKSIRMHSPNAYSEFNIQYNLHVSFVNHYELDFRFVVYPRDRHDYFETRTPGRYFVNHKYYEGNVFLNTDSRKPFSVKLRAGAMNSFDYDLDISYREFGVFPHLRLNNQLSLGLNSFFFTFANQPGFVEKDSNTGEIVFGKRDRRNLENIFLVSYALSNRMSLDFRARHYWSLADYDSYYALLEDGRLEEIEHSTNHDISFNAFNIDMTLRWNFAPGSEVAINWKNAVYSSTDRLDYLYWNNLQNTLSAPQINSISIKLLYYFDRLFR